MANKPQELLSHYSCGNCFFKSRVTRVNDSFPCTVYCKHCDKEIEYPSTKNFYNQVRRSYQEGLYQENIFCPNDEFYNNSNKIKELSAGKIELYCDNFLENRKMMDCNEEYKQNVNTLFLDKIGGVVFASKMDTFLKRLKTQVMLIESFIQDPFGELKRKNKIISYKYIFDKNTHKILKQTLSPYSNDSKSWYELEEMINDELFDVLVQKIKSGKIDANTNVNEHKHIVKVDYPFPHMDHAQKEIAHDKLQVQENKVQSEYVHETNVDDTKHEQNVSCLDLMIDTLNNKNIHVQPIDENAFMIPDKKMLITNDQKENDYHLIGYQTISINNKIQNFIKLLL